MNKLILTLLVLFFGTLIGYSQPSALNLDFEETENDFPKKWQSFGSADYTIDIDSSQAQNGKLSAVIESHGNKSDFKALAIYLPHNYDGKIIRLSGYIKTENITNGYAGLWLRIDPQLGFDNMNKRGIKGTTDWTKYEISLPLTPEKTNKIVLGGLLVGKGKMWLDNLHVSIDGKDLDDAQLKIFTKEKKPAELDQEFDNGSRIAFPDLTHEVVTNLELLGRIWGFLKYHHPAIARGNYNWDYELFRVLPDYLKVKNNEERDKVLNTWIEKYGRPSICTTCKPTTADAVLKPDLSWITTSNLSTHLKSSLREIYNNRSQGANYYIQPYPFVNNPHFTHENAYAQMPYPDSGFRLLSLYRYWNMIEYYFPNKHLTDKNWNIVLKEYIPVFLTAKNELEYELAALQIIGEVKDSHANLWGGGNKISDLRGNNFAAFKAEFIEHQLVVTDYFNPEFASQSKLKRGDVITHINGKSVRSIVDSLKVFYPSSNEAAMLRDISADLLRSSETRIELKYLSDNQTKVDFVPLHDRKQLNMYQWYKVNKKEKCYQLLNGDIGYITLAHIKEKDIADIKTSFKKTKGIIIDIRNYPSYFVPFALGSYFMKGPTSFVKFTKYHIDNPGEFTFMEGPKIIGDKNPYKGKLVVLVNEKSQSQAEYTAMAFRSAPNSTIIGSTTAGADGNVSTILLPGDIRTMISGLGIYYPDGKETQRVGIVPDITVTPTIDGIKNGRDEVLEKAIELINAR